MSKVKICGLTEIREAEIVNQYGADYAGIVLFYPKSKRNLPIGKAREIITILNSNIKKVAVVVSPTVEQIKNCKEAGFDYIQIHGICTKEVLGQSELPVFLAINIGNDIGEPMEHKKIVGYTLDGKVPGNGKTFDWKLVKSFKRKGKLLMLAGGLTPENVAESIHILKPDIVDVSSGVEYENGKGKDPKKIGQFIREVRKSREEIGGKEKWNGIMENLVGNMYQNH